MDFSKIKATEGSCRAFEITKAVVRDFINKGKSFYWDELQRKCLDNDGVLIVDQYMTLGQYITTFEENGIIYYDGVTRSFGFVSDIKKRMEKRRQEYRKSLKTKENICTKV